MQVPRLNKVIKMSHINICTYIFEYEIQNHPFLKRKREPHSMYSLGLSLSQKPGCDKHPCYGTELHTHCEVALHYMDALQLLKMSSGLFPVWDYCKLLCHTQSCTYSLGAHVHTLLSCVPRNGTTRSAGMADFS